MKSAKLLPLSHWVAFVVVGLYPLYAGDRVGFLPWIAVTAGLALLGCAHQLFGRFLPAADVAWRGFGLLGLDAALVSLLIYYSGGISSPLFPLIFLFAATGSLYDRWTKALSLAVEMSACYLAACIARGLELSSQGSALLVNNAVLIGSSVLLSYLSELDRREHSRTERVEALYRLSSDLVEKVDLEDTLRHLLSSASSFFGTDANAARLLDRTSGKTLREASCAVRGGGDVLAAVEEILAAVEREKRPLLINDIASDQRFASLSRGGLGLRSALAAPILVGGEAVGAFSFASTQPRDFTPDDLRMLVTISNLTASVIARAELYQIILSRSEVIVESMSSGLLVTDASGRVVLANQAARDLLGLTEGMPRDVLLRDLLDETLLDAQNLWDSLEQGRENGEGRSQGHLEMRLRGTPERILSVRVSPIMAGYEPNSGSVVIMEDITERVKVDEIRDDLMLLIARRVEEQTALYEVGRSLVDEVDTRNLLEFLLSKAVGLVDAQFGALSLRDEDGLYRIKVVQGLDARNIGLSFMEGEYLTGKVLADRRPLRGLDIKPAEAVPWGGGITIPLSYLAAPITWQGEITGVIEVASHPGHHAFGEDDLRLLSLFVNQAAIALENSNLYRLITEDQRRTEAMLHSINDGVIAVNNDAKVILVNAAAERILRLPPSSSVNERHVKEVIRHPDLANTFLRSLNSGQELDKEVVLSEPDERILEIQTSLIETGPGERLGIIAIIRDVTALRKLEQAKSDFVSTVSHELRTPLTSIKAYTATLRRRDVGFDEDTRQEFLKIVEEETDRLARLISDLLDISRIESGRLELKKRDLDLSKLAEIVVEKIRSQTDKHRIRLLMPGEALMARVDPDKIEQVLVNLLDNAVKYSPDGGEITVSIKRSRRFVEFSVSDQGVGIPPEHLLHIFDKFHRVDNRATREIYGTGLGLYVSKSIIEAHGGTIWAESEGGVGSAFFFTLPLAPKPEGDGSGDERVTAEETLAGEDEG